MGMVLLDAPLYSSEQVRAGLVGVSLVQCL